MTIKELMESPVGFVGRTKKSEAEEHIANTDLEKKFKKIVKELGGKTVARQLLATLDSKGDTPEDKGIYESKDQTPAEYLRKAGFKIKSEEPTKKGIELEFYKDKDSKSALEDLTDAGFLDKYSLSLAGKFIEVIEL